ncbi:putative calcium-binding protein [Labeo rohita]|uniref:Calcium-binding protein n=1 Tax=Labeo rohita TaxID=84645 RepID=A0ABQ8L5V3_LABRO|nr:putative calcium-binding protein [Labeo rohita]
MAPQTITDCGNFTLDLKQRGFCASPLFLQSGSRRSFQIDSTSSVPSFWSSNPRPRRKHTRTVDPSLLAKLTKATTINTGKNDLLFGLWNIRSLSNKGPFCFDFFCLTETWQQSNDFFHLNHSILPGYVFTSKPRHVGRGGGLAILHKEKWKVITVPEIECTSFESVALQIKGVVPTILAVVYRPPKANPVFLKEFSIFLTSLCSLSPNVVLVGDFNIHVDDAESLCLKEFLSCLDSFGLQQFIKVPTHSEGHTLDLVCCSGVIPDNVITSDLSLSDHMLVSFNVVLSISKSNLSRTITFRNIKNIDGRRLERLCAKTGLVVHKDLYADHMKVYKSALSTAKMNYYAGLIGFDAGNTKSLFSLINTILKPTEFSNSHTYSTELCEEFMLFF